MTVPANAAVRERRRRATPLDLERMNVMKALTAAEHSRRQFILNFAASRHTQLLLPGQKSDVVRAAEKWAADWLGQKGFDQVGTELFRYTVDARLWATHVGDDIEFPFAFMMPGKPDSPSSSDVSIQEPEQDRLKDETAPACSDKEILAALPESEPCLARRPKKHQHHQSAPPSPRLQSRRPAKKRPSVEVLPDPKRSLSPTSVAELKAPKPGQEKFPFFLRLGRSWSRRMSST